MLGIAGGCESQPLWCGGLVSETSKVLGMRDLCERGAVGALDNFWNLNGDTHLSFRQAFAWRLECRAGSEADK